MPDPINLTNEPDKPWTPCPVCKEPMHPREERAYGRHEDCYIGRRSGGSGSKVIGSRQKGWRVARGKGEE